MWFQRLLCCYKYSALGFAAQYNSVFFNLVHQIRKCIFTSFDTLFSCGTVNEWLCIWHMMEWISKVCEVLAGANCNFIHSVMSGGCSSASSTGVEQDYKLWREFIRKLKPDQPAEKYIYFQMANTIHIPDEYKRSVMLHLFTTATLINIVATKVIILYNYTRQFSRSRSVHFTNLVL